MTFTVESREDDLAAAKTALALLGAALFIAAQFFSWLLLAFAASGDSAPPRMCPCPFHATAWTFVFWTPVVAVGVGAAWAVAAQRFGGLIFTVAVVAATVALVVLDYVYLADVRRVWSLPPLPRL
jgi:hypothetical protein